MTGKETKTGQERRGHRQDWKGIRKYRQGIETDMTGKET